MKLCHTMKVIGLTPVFDPKGSENAVPSTRFCAGATLGEKSDPNVLVATTGRVKLKVDATKSPIQIGDLLATSDAPVSR